MNQSAFLHEIGAGTARQPYEFDYPRINLAALAVRGAMALAVSLAVVIAAIFAATTPSLAPFLTASIWAAGFVFLAIAVEVGIKSVYPYVATGIALPVLALLGSRLAIEFSVFAAVIVAAWLAVWIVRRK